MAKFISPLMMEVNKTKELKPHETLGTLGTNADER
jgi:hypothetical protein